MTMDAMADDGFAVHALLEAIETLGLLQATALPDLAKILPHFMGNPSYLLEFQKSGTPLSQEEKVALGLSSRVSLSKEMAGHLTLAGMQEAGSAHAVTLQRAALSVSRHHSLEAAKLYPFPVNVLRNCPYTARCPLADTWTALDEVDALPPEFCGDSEFRTCRSAFSFRRKGRL